MDKLRYGIPDGKPVGAVCVHGEPEGLSLGDDHKGGVYAQPLVLVEHRLIRLAVRTLDDSDDELEVVQYNLLCPT